MSAGELEFRYVDADTSSSPHPSRNEAPSPAEEGLTMREARSRYFEANGFAPDGGYADAWVDFHVGPIPLPFPNTQGRRRALVYHDLHHVLTGYPTTFRGELEISAWELGAGCKAFLAAWHINLGAMALGAWLHPRPTWRAFLRGRASRSLYGEDLAALLDRTVEDVRTAVGIAPPGAGAATWRDRGAYVAAAAVGLVSGTLTLGVVLPLVPAGLAAGWWRALRGR